VGLRGGCRCTLLGGPGELALGGVENGADAAGVGRIEKVGPAAAGDGLQELVHGMLQIEMHGVAQAACRADPFDGRQKRRNQGDTACGHQPHRPPRSRRPTGSVYGLPGVSMEPGQLTETPPQGCQAFCGKPRLSPPWLGSSQREVMTLPRVKKCTPSVPWAWLSPNREFFQPPKE